MRRRRCADHEPGVGRSSGSIRRRRCTTCAGAHATPATAWTISSGCSRSRAPCRPATSSAATPARGASGSRPCTSRTAGRSIKGVSKPGEIVWSRVYVEDDALQMDLGRGGVVALPHEETERRWQADHAAVADHARGALRRDARPVHGATQGQPHPGGLRARRRRRAARARDEGGHGRPPWGSACTSVATSTTPLDLPSARRRIAIGSRAA